MVGLKPLVVCIMGPTASGKTALALALARHYPVEIISVDSALVYRGMDIGTAKPSLEERRQVRHHLIDIRDPGESYSAAEFRKDAVRLIGDIVARGRLPLLTGGTMLYFRVLLQGIAELPAADPAIRKRLAQELADHGLASLYLRLQQVDPVAGARLKPGDTQRILRALEVYESSGRNLTQWWRQSGGMKPRSGETLAPNRPTDSHEQPDGNALAPDLSGYRFLQLAVSPPDRQQLHERIARRFRQMLSQGLVAEVAGLRARKDLDPTLPALRCVGYRQAWQYLAENRDEQWLEERGIIATRQLAKRQLTWLRGWPGLHWLNGDDPAAIAKISCLIEELGGFDSAR